MDLKKEIREEISGILEHLAEEARELYLDKEVPVLGDVPSPLLFHREYVTPNKPVLIQGAINNWPALQKWSPLYFREKVGELPVSVTVTPNGYADAVKGDYFVMPEERTMKFAEFLDILEKPDTATGIFYIQKQNSNFTEEFKEIIQDAETELTWATESFGKQPDAVNFWMGDERAITSMHRDHYENLYCVVSGWKRFLLIPPTDLPFIPYVHRDHYENLYCVVSGWKRFLLIPPTDLPFIPYVHRDHYENLYCVVSGWKRFLLIPPTDLPFIPYEEYPCAKYRESEDGTFYIEEDKTLGKVPWIAVDPLSADMQHHPRFSQARVYDVTVRAGETLYLPSLWFHHVRQSHGCIAVNFWYDMEFDIKYNYYKFLENIVNLLPKKNSKDSKSSPS